MAIADDAAAIISKLESGIRFSKSEADDAMLILLANSSLNSTPTTTMFQQTFTAGDWSAGANPSLTFAHGLTNGFTFQVYDNSGVAVSVNTATDDGAGNFSISVLAGDQFDGRIILTSGTV